MGSTNILFFVGDLDLNLMTDAWELKLVSSRAIANDILIEGYL